MKKAILYRFTGVLLLALIICSIFSYYAFGTSYLNSMTENMLKTLHVIDYALDYEENLQEQINDLQTHFLQEDTRITMIDMEGTVHADSMAENVTDMENHKNREEVKAAMEDEYGYATRVSDTLNISMLFVAGQSQTSDYIIRLAFPFSGIMNYMTTIFPVLLAGVFIALLVSTFVAAGFAEKISKPMREIAKEMKQVKKSDIKPFFRTYQYEELNIISATTSDMSEDIREYLNQIEFEKKVRQEFFSNASHELKTPITSIKGYAELLDQGFVKDEETRKDFIARILKETDNMANLIDDILKISRLETNETKETFSEVRLNPLLDEIFESIDPIAAEYQVMLYRECEPLSVWASAKQLRELIMNLLINGIKYNYPGGDVFLTIYEKDSQLVVCVKDNGVGIGEEEQERVFERFYRVDKGRSKKMGGTGLGLAIVKHIVEYNHGTITLKSELLKGSEFIITLPMK